MMPRELAPICDVVFWEAITARKYPLSHSPATTVAFRTQYEVHYKNINEPPPEGAKTGSNSTGKATDWWSGLNENVRNEWSRYFLTGQF